MDIFWRMSDMVTMITILVSMVTVASGSWANDLGGMLSRSCMYGFGIHGIQSRYESNYGDRLWQIECKMINIFGGDDICTWTCKLT